MFKKILHYFTPGEWLLWLGSLALISLSFALFDRENILTLAASLVGATSLIFCAKGNPLGQVLMLAFSVLYGIISYTFAYYGEMITYLGMTAPMAVFALVAWLRHPYKGQRAQVAVGRLKRGEWLWMLLAAAAITAAFWFILEAFHTANLVPSTVSVTTSFLAVYLTPLPLLCARLRRQRRGPHRAVGPGDAGGHLLPLRGGVLCAVFSQRPVRILELDAHAPRAADGRARRTESRGGRRSRRKERPAMIRRAYSKKYGAAPHGAAPCFYHRIICFYSLSSPRMLRRISCQETRNAVTR